MAYKPTDPRGFDAAQSQWLATEQDKIAREFVEAKDYLPMRVLYAAPLKPRAGWLVYADGTMWNPGSGQGVYRYTLAGAWAYVG
jgi:hypothetical protein